MSATDPNTDDRFSAVDAELAVLSARQRAWFERPIEKKRQDLTTLVARTAQHAKCWVEVATRAKGGAPGSTVEAEEWMSGPWALSAVASALAATLERISRGQAVVQKSRLRALRSGQIAVDVFPWTPWDRLLLNGYRVEVWMEPGVNRETFDAQVAALYRGGPHQPGVMLVLGAGNIASIPPLDILHALFAEGLVTLCKLNPVNDYLMPVFERIFEPLIAEGFVRFVRGGAEVGAHLIAHAQVSAVHITGAAQSHDAIVYGDAERKARNEPRLHKPITSELGGVGPVIIVPGPWTEADLLFQAENIATQKLHNSGFNCIAAQVLITQKSWASGSRLLALVHEEIARSEPRPAYYPGAQDRSAAALSAHAGSSLVDARVVRIPALDPHADAAAFQTEFFSPAWAETALDAPDAAAFLSAAVDFANDRLMGTLGAQILIHPATAKALGPKLEDAVARLRYGTIGINAWSGVGFLLPNVAWGAYPGHTLQDIQSGRGFVHNALLLGRPQKSVIYAPFAPFPRALSAGEIHLSPKPPWFITHKQSARVARLLCEFEAAPSVLKLPAIFAAALAG